MKWSVTGSLVLVLGQLTVAQAATNPPSAPAPLTVPLCTLLENPAAYNHRFIKVTGKISRGFEDFTLTSVCHGSRMAVWLDFGGTQGTQVKYCCGDTMEAERNRPLVVEGMPTTLVQDDTFRRFQALTRDKPGQSGEATATLVGWFFAGQKQAIPGGTRWMGYGHMGFFSLLVIQRVADVREQ